MKFCSLYLLLVLLGLGAHASQTVIENQVRDNGLLVQNSTELVIRNCTLSNRAGSYGLKLVNCENVVVENCRIQGVGNERSYEPAPTSQPKPQAYVFRAFDAFGVYLYNCRNVTVRNSEVIDIFGQGIRVDGESHTATSQITLEGNRIAYIYDDAIKYQVKGDQKDGAIPGKPPFRGGVIKDNVIHDIGLGVTRLPFARHGMYLKAADILVEGNTIYNVFYGSGISLRNAGVIRNNRISNCIYACIAYHQQTLTTESTKVVVIENNECRQDYGFNPPMRHVSRPEDPFNPSVKGAIYIGYSATAGDSPFHIRQFVLRNNRCTLYKDYPEVLGKTPVPMVSLPGISAATQLDVCGNVLDDQRTSKRYFNIAGCDAANTLK